MPKIYNAPHGEPSSIGPQVNVDYWDRKSLIDVAEDMFFSPLADVRWMPMHYGKELKVFYYVPLLDDRNVNDQGIDANGVTLLDTDFYVTLPSLEFTLADGTAAGNAVTAINAIEAAVASNVGAVVTVTKVALAAGDEAEADAVVALVPGTKVYQGGGNLYGSSKDVGTITSRMPTLGEEGGRVNRVGSTRIERKGSISEYGIFSDFTADSLMFDTDAELYSHWSREMVTGANKITEALLQTDLLNAAGTIVFTGVATNDGEMTGEGADPSVVTYNDLKKLSITLDDNLTPKNTTIIKGSRFTDTKTVNAARIMYVGSDLQIMLENMLDGLGNPAFTHVREYADAGTLMNGEIGAIADFRIIVVPEMQRWEGAGDDVGTNPGYAEASGKYNIYPMLVVGNESFATVGLQTGGKKKGKQKFKIIVKKPGKEMAQLTDPYGKVGFSSIAFWHGFIALRPERIGLVKTCAPE